MTVLSSSSLRSLAWPRRVRRRRPSKIAATATMAAMFAGVIAAVNERGLCAAAMARAAALPSSEVGNIAAQCACPDCFRARAN